MCILLAGNLFDTQKFEVWKIAVALALVGVGVFLQLQPVSERRGFLNLLGKQPAARRPVLVLALSSSKDVLPSHLTLSGTLSDDLAALAAAKREAQVAKTRGQFWSWEQALRAIHHHAHDNGPLRRVVLLCSPESIVQVHEFHDKVIRVYRELNDVVFDVLVKRDSTLLRLEMPGYAHARQNGFDFEDFDELTEAYDGILRLLDKEGVPAKQVQIDFTAGQKPTSVVAAAITLFSNASNQYVATNPFDANADPWEYKVWGYDFREVHQPKD